MTKRHLEIFVAVVEHGKMSEAAKALYITQSSVSQAVSEIEKEYGVLLFERASRSLYLTDVGRRLLDYARRVLALQSEMDSFLRDSSQRQTLRIGATVTVGTCVIGPLVTALKQELPAVRAEVFVANTHILEEKLLKGELDAGLVEGRVTSPDLTVERAIPDRMVMICGREHPFYGRMRVDIQELANQPMLLRERGSGTREQLERQMQRLHIPLDTVWNCYNTEAIINGVQDGHGISVLSQRLVMERVCQGKMWMCDIDGIDLERSFDLVLHKSRAVTPSLRRFLELCRAYGARKLSAPPVLQRFAGDNA